MTQVRPGRSAHRRHAGRSHGGNRRLLAAGLVAALAVTLGGQVPAQAQAPAQAKRLAAQRYESVPVKPVKATKPAPDPAETAAAATRPTPTWPAAGAAEVTLSSTPTGERAASTVQALRAGSLPVTVRPAAPAPGDRSRSAQAGPRKVRIEVLPRATAEKAGVRGGLLMRVSRADGVNAGGRVEIAVDYARFASAYGGDWASRLRLVQVPPCALSTPDAASCRIVELGSRNNVRARTVSAQVSAASVPAAENSFDPSASAG
ncbi:hypothetical protein [Micromonospora sp. KC723]|uniref:hypothetical protein n=1 Tax=Micromonospora sp. KC723 TaxID=2530381 RepID=UPI001051A42C|nr:hypothetical protein [Micromonospora sp. KC723]TDB78362.1 hypothetical protein E1165_01525 [Micromonospora sp. KC723]